MKPHSVIIVGKVSNKGKPFIANKAEMDQFFKGWENESFIMEVNVYPKNNARALIAYYEKKVVPDFQNIFREIEGERLTLCQVDEKLKTMSPVMIQEIPSKESGGFKLVKMKSIYEISNSQLVEFVNHIRMIAAREYGHDIQDPKIKL